MLSSFTSDSSPFALLLFFFWGSILGLGAIVGVFRASEIMKYQGDGAGIMNLLSQDDVMSLASYEGFSVLCRASENE